MVEPAKVSSPEGPPEVGDVVVGEEDDGALLAGVVVVDSPHPATVIAKMTMRARGNKSHLDFFNFSSF